MYNQLLNLKDFFLHNTRVHQEGWAYIDAARNENDAYLDNLYEEPKGPFSCDICIEVIKPCGSVVKHLWIPHLFDCVYCELSFTRNTTLEDHVNTSHIIFGLINSNECGRCGETFGRSSSLASHVGTPHEFPCKPCNKAFTSRTILNKHTRYCKHAQIFSIVDICLDNINC